MSILIKDIEMPTEESEPMRIEVYADGTVFGIKAPDDIYEFKAVPIPPHGRLIDADALIADVRKHSESYFADDFAHEWVDHQPTIIEAEGE